MKPRDDISAIEAAAARWVVRLRDTPSDSRTEAEFDEWLAQSAEHRACYMRCEMAMAMTRELENDPAFKSDLEVCAAIVAADVQATRQRERFAGTRRLWLGLAVAATVAAVAVGALFVDRGPVPQDYRTSVGEQRTITLADQSVVTLNTDTSVSVLLDAKLRRVDLHQGEAFFSVAHDPSRAFEVWAAGGKVRAVGTEFGVEIDRDEVTVSVLEGAVIVSPMAAGRGTAPRVAANESVRYAANGRVEGVKAADALRINAWREGKLVFDEVPLAEAIAEFNRYTDRKVVLGSTAVGTQRVSGSLRIGDAESLQFLLRESLGLRAEEQGGSVLVLPATAEETGTRN